MSTAGTRLRLALVNDYEVVVRGLAHMLEEFEDLEVVELDSNTDVAQFVDVALYDTMAQSQGDGSDVATLVANPEVRHVIVYSWNLDHALQRRTLDAGVSGYVSKGLSASELAAAIREVASGQVLEAPTGPHDDEIDGPEEGDWPGREHGLTARESEVLALITQGKSNQEIAELSHLSINSVKTYIRHAYRKIGVDSRSKAVLWGIDHGFRPDTVRIRRP